MLANLLMKISPNRPKELIERALEFDLAQKRANTIRSEDQQARDQHAETLKLLNEARVKAQKAIDDERERQMRWAHWEQLESRRKRVREEPAPAPAHMPVPAPTPFAPSASVVALETSTCSKCERTISLTRARYGNVCGNPTCSQEYEDSWRN